MPIELPTETATAAGAATAKSGGLRWQNQTLFKPAAPGAKERMAFTEQLALLLGTGMPLHAALKSIRQQHGMPAMHAILDELIADVETGQRFSYALAQHPEFFSTTYVNVLSASEGGGFLPEVLEQLLSEEERQAELRKTVVSALTYPAFLVAFSVLTLIIVLVFVFPKFGDMFMRIRDQLPPTTIALMWCSDMLRAYWWQLLAVLGGAGLLCKRWFSSAVGRAVVDGWKLTLPGLRTVFAYLYITQSFRILSLAIGNGVTVSDALEATRDVVDNRMFRDLLTRVERSVQQGGTIAAAFNETDFVPDMVKQMVATAEESGNLAPVLKRVAEHYERDLKRRLESLSKMAEPVMLLVMGLVVGVLVSSLILPIFKLSKAIT